MNNDKHNVELPESLKRQFARLENRLWKVETVRAICVCAIALVASYLVLFFSDRVWNSPAWFRLLLFGSGVTVAIVAALSWIRVWIVKRRDWRVLAVLVQRRFRRLGDRLLGIVELSSEKEHAANYSPELYRAAIQQVAEEAGQYDFKEAVDSRPARKLGYAASALAGLVLLAAIGLPSASGNVLRRWILPFASIERYTLVQIADLPDRITVPHGEGFPLRARVNYRSAWMPSRASARFTKTSVTQGAVKNNELVFQIPGQVQKGDLRIKLGDAEKIVSIEPAHRPALKQLTAHIELPDYLQYPTADQKIQSASMTVLESSHVTFKGDVSRELASAELSFGTNVQAMDLSGATFTSLPVPADGISQVSFFWRDILGLSNASPWRLGLQLQKDNPPSVDLPDLGRDVAILQSDVLNLKVAAKDDYGILEIGLSWEYDAPEEAGDWATTEIRVQKNAPQEKRQENVFRWSPAMYRIPADSSAELVGFATDYFPGRQRSESSVHRIHVLGNEKHAELVRQNLESVLARVEEVTRLEERILARTSDAFEEAKQAEASKENAEATDAKSGDKQKASEKLGKLSEEQTQNAKNLDELSKEGMKALREGLKNPIFTEQALQEWAKTLQEMQQLSEKQMKDAAKNLKSAQQNSSNSPQQKQDLAAAQQQEEETLKELEKLQGKVNKGLDDLQALTMSERLRKLATTEDDITTELKKIIPETIGMLPQELPVKFRRIGEKLAGVQGTAHEETQKLQNEINRFFERTQKPNYGEVSKEMKELQTSDQIDELRELIQGNISMEASQKLAVWTERFTQWADKLQPPTEESQSGGGSGEGQGGEMNMTKTLIALLRLREKEVGLHSRTELLDEQREKLKDYPDHAKDLLSTQQDITSNLKQIEQENKIPILVQPYKETVTAMGKVESFLSQPQTDKATTDAQRQTIELLSDVINLINEQAKRNPPPSTGNNQSESESEAMSFLMQMMQPQMGPGQGMAMQQGGGNTGGGGTGSDAEAASGDSRGKAGEERSVNKASGTAGAAVPVEFRETLESYFKALEQEQTK